MPAAFSFLHSCDAQGLLVERAIEVRRLCLPVMAKTKVTFRPVRKSEHDWTIVAEYPALNGGVLKISVQSVTTGWRRP
jgi:hypothetical protein